MTHQEFKERLEEILVDYRKTAGLSYTNMDNPKAVELMALSHINTTNKLTQLFQDFKDTVIGEEEITEFGTKVDFSNLSNDALMVRKIRNNFRQTQHQTANLILGKTEGREY